MVKTDEWNYQYAQIGIAKCYIKQEKIDLAKNKLNETLIKYPKNISAYRYLGEIDIINKNAEQACLNFSKSLNNYNETKSSFSESYWSGFLEETIDLKTKYCK